MIRILACCFLLLFAGCKKGSVQTVQSGTYSGDFSRTCGANELCAVLPSPMLSIDFTNKTFSGDSKYPHFPAICNGTYSIVGDSIYFSNSCAFTADFDWTLILNGSFKILYLSEDSISFGRRTNPQNPDFRMDRYTLKRSN